MLIKLFFDLNQSDSGEREWTTIHNKTNNPAVHWRNLLNSNTNSCVYAYTLGW